MVGKMVLPSLGGTPAVWNTCMVFFQGVLLVGYGYTHTLSGWQSRRASLSCSLPSSPCLSRVPSRWETGSPPADHNPVFSVLWLCSGMVGLPFFVVATSARRFCNVVRDHQPPGGQKIPTSCTVPATWAACSPWSSIPAH